MIAHVISLEITCDAGECTEIFRAVVPGRELGDGAERTFTTYLQAFRDWTVVDGKHYCPAHKEKPE